MRAVTNRSFWRRKARRPPWESVTLTVQCMVQVEPDGGEKIGTFGGSGNIDAKNQIAYENVPPGRYVLRGHPNPYSENQQSDPVTIDLKGGQSAKVTLNAK